MARYQLCIIIIIIIIIIILKFQFKNKIWEHFVALCWHYVVCYSEI